MMGQPEPRSPIHFSTDYLTSNVTLGIHLNYRSSERLIFRSAVWTSIARPEYRYIEAGESYTYTNGRSARAVLPTALRSGSRSVSVRSPRKI
jgi:hypothetical protein